MKSSKKDFLTFIVPLKNMKDQNNLVKVHTVKYSKFFFKFTFCKCKNKKTGELLAVKKIKMDKEKEGVKISLLKFQFPITAIREINILKSPELNKVKNIIKLKQVITKTEQPRFYMIFEYAKHDLAGLIDFKINFKEQDIKCIIKQIIEGLWSLHQLNIIHRDLKSSNILITNEGKFFKNF